MATVVRGHTASGGSSAAIMRKKRRTIGAFRAHAMGESFDCHHSVEVSGNLSLGMVPEERFEYLGKEGGMGHENIVVAVRVRPLSAAEVAEGKRSCCDVLSSKTLVIRKGADPGAYLRSQKGSANEYSFDAVFAPEAGQSEVYEGTAKPHIPALLEGIDVTVFAYGATGAGKTHTMMGSERARREGDPEEVSGIVPQSLVELFRLLEERKEAGGTEKGGAETWSVRAGYLQVYNEQIMDLLSQESKPLKINEDPGKGIVVVAGLQEMEVASSEEILDLLRQGNSNRRTEATAANQMSSRSHAVLQVVVVRTLVDGLGSKAVRESKLSLIDLAGSERASATNNRGEQLRQGANINKSLLSLANCINALAGNRRRRGGGKGNGNVKYRDSKLTHLLKTSLEGNCRLVMIANVNPSHVFFDDSHNTLKYANRAKNIKVDPRAAEAVRSTSGLMTEKEARLVKEFQALKERNQEMEAQLESLRNSRERERIAPDPAGFMDLFAPNTSSILSVESSTPGDADPSSTVSQPPTAPGSGEAGLKTSSSVSSSSQNIVMPSGGETGIGDKSLMPPPAMPREADFGEVSLLEPGSGKRGTNENGSSDEPGSGSKRKRGTERRGDERDERAKLQEALAEERSRVRELEGKVRELENSMARMGAQLDVNMELINTFRNQKETAEKAAMCEQAATDDLLNLLKDKEAEIKQLRNMIGEPESVARAVISRGSGSSLLPAGRGAIKKRVNGNEQDGQSAARGSSSRPHLMMNGKGDSHPLKQVGDVTQDLSENHNASISARGVHGAAHCRTELSPSPSMRSELSTTLEVASAIASRRKDRMIPRARKSMIPVPSSSGRSSRGLGDITNSMGTRLNGHLGKGSVTPTVVKKPALQQPGTDPSNRQSSDYGVTADLGSGRAESRYAKKTRRVLSRTDVTPQQASVAGRTRSRQSTISSARGIR